VFIVELIYKADPRRSMRRCARTWRSSRSTTPRARSSSRAQDPRDGGVIIAAEKTRAEIEAIVKDDPFVKHGLAEFRIIEFRASQRAGDIGARIDKRSSADVPGHYAVAIGAKRAAPRFARHLDRRGRVPRSRVACSCS
jgi:hypothetical protein